MCVHQCQSTLQIVVTAHFSYFWLKSKSSIPWSKNSLWKTAALQTFWFPTASIKINIPASFICLLIYATDMAYKIIPLSWLYIAIHKHIYIKEKWKKIKWIISVRFSFCFIYQCYKLIIFQIMLKINSKIGALINIT